MKTLIRVLVVAVIGTASLLAAQPSSASYGTASQYTEPASPGPTDPNGPSL
jgi:hypothetical protein